MHCSFLVWLNSRSRSWTFPQRMFGAIRGIVVARGCDGTTKTEAMLFEETKMSVYTGLGEFDLVFLFALPGNKHLVMRSFALVSIIISSFFLPWNTMRVQSYWIDRKHFQVATFLHRYATTSPTFSCIFPVWRDTSLSLPGITGASEAFEYLLVFLQNTGEG